MKQLFLFLIICLFTISAQQNSKDIFLGKHYKMHSEKINEEREFFVSVPESYNNSDKGYPLLYLMDGENNFSTGLIGGIRFLEMLGEIPELIIVGVINTDRTRDVFPMKLQFRSGRTGGGGADNYLAFFSEELHPFINKNYRTAGYKIFYGTSNSAYTAIYEMFKNPANYDAYLASSPTLIRPFMEEADSLIKNWNGEKKYLNIIVGEKDFVNLPATTASFKSKIDQHKPKGIELKYNILEGEGHVPETSLIVGLKDLFKGWKFPDNISSDNYKTYIKHFDKLNKKFNLDVAPSESSLNSVAYTLLRSSDKVDEALSLFQYLVEKYPKSANAYDSLGEAYLTNGNDKLALKNYEKSLELNPDNRNAAEKIKELKNKNANQKS